MGVNWRDEVGAREWYVALEAVMAREKRTWHGVLSVSEIAMRRKQIACIAAVAAKAELRRQKKNASWKW